LRYVGGKSKLAKRIASDILARTDKRDVLIEPFVGGGAVLAELAPAFDCVYASDIHEDLMLMWNKFWHYNWEPDNYCSEQEYQRLRYEKPSALRRLVGFGQSFGGKWWGGYARGKKPNGEERNYLDETIRNIKNIISKLPENSHFTISSYKDWNPVAGDVIYCDPPYASTQGYGGTDSFDSQEFWKVMDEWKQLGADVFVSEYNAPDSWKEIASYPHRMELSLIQDRRQTTERLWH